MIRLLERILSRSHSNINVHLVSLLDLGDLLLGRRIDRGECFAALALVPLVVDENLKCEGIKKLLYTFLSVDFIILVLFISTPAYQSLEFRELRISNVGYTWKTHLIAFPGTDTGMWGADKGGVASFQGYLHGVQKIQIRRLII